MANLAWLKGNITQILRGTQKRPGNPGALVAAYLLSADAVGKARLLGEVAQHVLEDAAVEVITEKEIRD